jgi:putative N6-adenine-specific DNA methylase
VVHKAAAQRLCKVYKRTRLPEGEGIPQAELRVYVDKDMVQLLLDLSGAALFKRGYRSEGGAAPLRETSAASLLLLSGWKRKFPLYDPFCGSGTIAIEAALYAWNMAPNLGRSFALSALAIGDAKIENKVRTELLTYIDTSNIIRITGSDADSRAVAMAKANARRAYGLAGKQVFDGTAPFMPQFKVLDMTEAASADEGGYIITNPPYGRRLGDASDAESLYRDMNVLLRRFPGWKLGVISDHPGFESHFGKQADSARKITNGAIDSYFYEYEAI